MKTLATPIALVVLIAQGCSSQPTVPAVALPAPTAGGESSAAAPAQDIVGEEVSYSSGGTTLKGYLAYDRAKQGPRPGVIVVHEWWGHNEYVRTRARMLAEMGYTALAIDMYGDGKNTSHPADAKKFMMEALANMPAAQARFDAGRALLEAHESTDAARTAAIGYCFGGAVVLHMARSGADLDAVASFHGSLGTQAPAEAGAVSSRLLVMTGAADPMVPPDQVAAFEREMTLAGAPVEVVSYPGAVHAFTNPGATALGKAHGLPLAHDPAADADSWQRLDALLKTTFAAPEPTAQEKKKAAKAAKNRGNLAQLGEDAKKEAARWTDELRAASKKLAETKHKSTKSALKKILAGAHRAPGNSERDAARHAGKTLAFFGIKPDMTVFEYGPGAGWYTELLAPLLAARGKLIVNHGDPSGPAEVRSTFYARRFQHFLDKAPEIYGKVQTIRVDRKAPVLGLDGTLDMALVIRGAHGWKRRGATAVWLAEIHKALAPKGVLGIVQHRAAEGRDPKAAAEKGRWSQKALVEAVEAAGFKLDKSSELNANPKDERGYAEGVWTLPPTLRLGELDRDKYVAIGESDRMTLRFVKVTPAAPAAPAAPKVEKKK